MRNLRAKGVGVRWIIYENARKDFEKHFRHYIGDAYRARVLKGAQQTPVATIILKDRVQISLFYPHPTIVEIVNESLAAEYKRYFDLLWLEGKEMRRSTAP